MYRNTIIISLINLVSLIIEFKKLTKDALLTHLFLEQSDEMMGRMAQDILIKTPEGDANTLH